MMKNIVWPEELTCCLYPVYAVNIVSIVYLADIMETKAK